MWQIDYEIVIGGIQRKEYFCTNVTMSEITDAFVRGFIFRINNMKDDGRNISWAMSIKDGVL